MKVVGLIPARAGSKRLPNKNLTLLGGQPLIAHACEAALGSGVLTAVYINTDCPRIAAVAQECGVPCPALRPPELARDDAATRDANRFLLKVLSERGEHYDAVMVLQPTSPLRCAGDIRGALELFERDAPCAVVSVSPVAPAAWLGRIGKGGGFEPWHGDELICRLNGAIYVYTCGDYLHERTPRKTLAYPMPASRGVDVDTIEDLRHAEALLQCAHAV
ncbi:MAG: acylneuraminate cytidylyltransferase family protein [Planctomycetes bacterium]|nr:acylneuraminate cytidylyltransferase family protein [Planctomycetota bacterium]